MRRTLSTYRLIQHRRSFWLKNRDPEHWRDARQLEHTLGKYHISEKPMTKEEWIKARAIDVTPKEEVDVTVPVTRKKDDV
jgi:hypothetical protein